MRCSRKVYLTCAVILVCASVGRSMASTSRLRAMGNETRIIADDTNLFVYPSVIVNYPEVIAEPFDNWGGVIYGLGEERNKVVAVMFQRPIRSAMELNELLSGKMRGRLSRELEVNPWIDFMYGTRLRKDLSLATQLSYAYGAESNGTQTSGYAMEFKVGTTIGNMESKRVDLALGLNLQGFEDKTDSLTVKSKGGLGVALDGRIFLPMSETIRLIPLLEFAYGGIDVDPDESAFVEVTGGLGANMNVGPFTQVVFGALLTMNTTKKTPAVGSETTDIELLLPKLMVGGETVVGSMRVRVGFERSAIFRTFEEVDEDGTIDQRKSFDTAFNLEFGLGFTFGGMKLDGVMEKNLLRDGPHFIGGAAHGGGLFSGATITYTF